MYKFSVMCGAVLLFSIPLLQLYNDYFNLCYVLMNVSSFIAGIVFYFFIIGYLDKIHFGKLENNVKLVLSFFIVFAIINVVNAVVIVVCNLDCLFISFASILPFLIPLSFVRFIALVKDIPEFEYSFVIINNLIDNQDSIENSYSMLFRLKIRIDKHETIVINTKGAENLKFSLWIKRVILDYNLRYPYKSVDVNRIGDMRLCFYHYKFFLFRKWIDVDKTFSDNGLKNNCMIYGKQIG